MLEVHRILVAGSNPRNYEMKAEPSLRNGGYIYVNAVSVRQAYLFGHKKQYAKSPYGVGIIEMEFFKYDGVLQMVWELPELRNFLTDREWAKKEYVRRVEQVNKDNNGFRWE